MTSFPLPKIPLDKWISAFVDWLIEHFDPVFGVIGTVVEAVVDSFEWAFLAIPTIVMIILLTLLAYRYGRRSVAVFTLVGLLLIDNLGYWEHTMQTLSLVLTASLLSVIIGVPVGIWSARNDTVRNTITPLLDFMQTMPAFVYLIPAVFFFNLGVVPGVFASVIFSMPPTIRLTNLGIRQVPVELIEAADAFGSTPGQKLRKLQLPLAKPMIMAGINQSIMLALSMVVIASMIGAGGLGADVYRAVTQIKIGVGFEAGLAIVILAIMLDRITQNIGKKVKQEER